MIGVPKFPQVLMIRNQGGFCNEAPDLQHRGRSTVMASHFWVSLAKRNAYSWQDSFEQQE